VIVESFPLGIGIDGPTPVAPAGRWDPSSELSVVGPGSLVAIPAGPAELSFQSASVANDWSAPSDSPWSVTSLTPHPITTFSTYWDGFSSWPTPLEPVNAGQPNLSWGFLAVSNRDGNFYADNTVMFDPLVAPVASQTLEVFLVFGAGPPNFDSSARALPPLGGVDFTPQEDAPSALLETAIPGLGSAAFASGSAYDSTIPRGLAPRSGPNGNDAETAFAASLPSSLASPSSALQMAAVQNAGGRASSGLSMQSAAGLSLQVDHSLELIAGGWISSVAAKDWGSGGVQSPISPRDDWTIDAGNVGDPISSAAITASGAPLGLLLTGPGLPAQTTTDDFQQVAELISSDASSLALGATLWTVPSEVRTGAEWVQASDPSLAWLSDATTIPLPTAYMIGLDQALEQSCREIQQRISPSPGRVILNKRDQLDLDRQLEWEWPIVPGATGWVSDRQETSRADMASVVNNDAIDSVANDQSQAAGGVASSLHGIPSASPDAPAPSEFASFVKASALPLLSTLSAITAATGWFWTRRNRKRLPSLPSLGTLGG